LSGPRAAGARAERACAEKAQRVTGLDLDRARAHVLMLLSRGPQSGEDLVDQLKKAGFIGHDDRCFGAVFSLLANRQLIKCVGFTVRKRGHGTAGGRIWQLCK
jgi:hypothetical protein